VMVYSIMRKSSKDLALDVMDVAYCWVLDLGICMEWKERFVYSG